MEHTAKLIRLPLRVRFPPDLEGKITFDAANQRLVWCGFMTEEELCQLRQVHPDSDYQRALANLFEDCNRIETPFTRRLNLALTILAAMCLIWAAVVLIGLFRTSQKQPKADSVFIPAARQG